MKYARFFSIFVFAAAGLYGMAGFYFLPLANFEGDLTRMGKLPEALFGWTKEQPILDPNLMRQASWQEADVLVIGDSFSDPRIWQTALTREGLHVRTESWASVRAICDDFTPWLLRKGFKGKHVIFEIIERNVEEPPSKSIGCHKMEPHSSTSADQPRDPPATWIDRSKADYSGRLSVGIATRSNVSKYEQLSAQPDFKSWDAGGGSRMVRMANGCDLFSHLRCRDVLFYGGDNERDLAGSVLDNIGIINARLQNLTPVWVIIPDKSTVYLRPEKKFWEEAERRFQSPNVLKAFRQATQDKTVDLYPANNTHLSTTGYLFMGNLIYRAISANRS